VKKARAIIDRIEELKEHREVMLQYASLVRRNGDWHGVMDAAADIRELDAELTALRWVLHEH
jgi:hypothetical protein